MAGRRARTREVRAHWLLLVLGLGAVAAALLLHGFANHMVGASTTRAAECPPGAGAPDPQAGPILRAGPGRIDQVGMPARTIALTFDDGPDPQWTPRVLEVLERHHVPATFFMLGSNIARHPDLARRVHDAGHEIGTHTYTHADIGAEPAWRTSLETGLTRNALAGAVGIRSHLFRPPYSSTPAALCGATLGAVRDLGRDGYLTVLTDLDSRDWSRPGAAGIVEAATPAKDRGAVVLFHDAGGDRAQTVEALDTLITSLTARGYRFTTVSQGLGLPAAEEKVGGAERVRGEALVYAQRGASLFADVMTWVMTIAGVLTVGRLVVLLVIARVHVRRVRRKRRRGGRPPEVNDPVSVLVPAYNEAAGIEATVRSLAASTHRDIEIVVIDDGSTDGTADIVEALRLPNVQVIRQRNAGKAAALNTGIAWSSHNVIVMIDGDTVFEPDAVHRLVQSFADPAVGAISGNTKVGNRRRVLGRWQHLEYVIGFNLDRRMFDVLECMPTVPGAIGAFRREALERAGGVSEDTLAEDTDLTMALCRDGWRVVYEEKAIAWTEAPESLRQLWRQRYRWCYGTLQAMWKHRGALFERGALRLDRERLGPLWALPLQQFVYRQLMYLVVIQSVVTAVLGSRLRWHRMQRTGSATDTLDGTARQGA